MGQTKGSINMIAKTIAALSFTLMALAAPLSAQARDLDKIQEDFLKLKFGMFIHFNMSTFVPGGWSTGKEDPLAFNPENLDMGKWADAAKSAKMKYAILTVKHTGGWCLWPTKTTDHNVSLFKNYKDGKADIVQEFVDAFRSRDIKVGFYYCFPLWGKCWPNHMTLPHKDYATGKIDARGLIEAQFKELLTNYGDVSVIWVDQSTTPNGGIKPGDWVKIKQFVHKLQPNCVVIANNSSDFERTDIYGFEFPYSLEMPAPDNTKPTEVCDKLNGGWFSNPRGSAPPVRSAHYIVNRMLIPLNNRNSNYLLNCSPEHTGNFNPETITRLKEIGDLWDPENTAKQGDGIYGIIDKPVESINTGKPECFICFNKDLSKESRGKVAEILKKHNSTATFFVSENSVRNERKSLTALVKAGNALGNPTTANEPIDKEKGLGVGKHIYPIQNYIKRYEKPVAALIPGDKYSWNIWTALSYFSLVAIKPGYTATDAQSATDIAAKAKPGDIIMVNSTPDAINALNGMLDKLTTRGLKCENIRSGLLRCTDKKLQLTAKDAGAKVETGRE